jgi:hypothetical protein
MAVNEILGADVETGGVWDPLKLSKDEGQLYRYRAVELKHGKGCVSVQGRGKRLGWVRVGGVCALEEGRETGVFDDLNPVLC